MLARFNTNKVKLGVLLFIYGACVLALDALGAGDITAIGVSQLVIWAIPLFVRRLHVLWFSNMLFPGLFICTSSSLVYGLLNWVDRPSTGMAYSAISLLGASFVFAIYRAFSTPI
jgi:hypothetical protein